MKKSDAHHPESLLDLPTYDDLPRLRLQESIPDRQALPPAAVTILGMTSPHREANTDFDIEDPRTGAAPCSIH